MLRELPFSFSLVDARGVGLYPPIWPSDRRRASCMAEPHDGSGAGPPSQLELSTAAAQRLPPATAYPQQQCPAPLRGVPSQQRSSQPSATGTLHHVGAEPIQPESMLYQPQHDHAATAAAFGAASASAQQQQTRSQTMSSAAASRLPLPTPTDVIRAGRSLFGGRAS